jgi:hypothetical protein
VEATETRLCVSGNAPACYRITSDWATGVLVLVGRLPGGDLLVVQAHYRSVPTQESRFVVLRLAPDGRVRGLQSLRSDDTVETNDFGRFRLSGDRLLVAQPSARAYGIAEIGLGS